MKDRRPRQRHGRRADVVLEVSEGHRLAQGRCKAIAEALAICAEYLATSSAVLCTG